jgi:hypothetical protein
METADKVRHTPEPWTVDGRDIVNRTGWKVGSTSYSSNSRRIVACVNACEGVPLDALEAGVIREILLLCDQTAEGKLRELVERAFGRH